MGLSVRRDGCRVTAAMSSEHAGATPVARARSGAWWRFTAFVDQLDYIRKLALIVAAVLGVIPVSLAAYSAIKALTPAPPAATATATAAPTVLAVGVPNVYGEDVAIAVNELTAAGYIARTIPVCSSEFNLASSKVRQVLTDVGIADGVVLVDKPGVVTQDGRQLPRGSYIVVKVTRGVAC